MTALVLAGLVPMLVACGDDDPEDEASSTTQGTSSSSGSAAEEAQQVDVTIPGGEQGEYTFEADLDGLVAGPVTISLTNNGSLEHQAMVLRLNDGQDVNSFAAAAAADPSGIQALALVEGFGGPNAVAPGDTRSSTQVLEAGDYMLICVIPDENGMPHATHGMLVPFTVGAADDADAASTEPVVDDPADADVTLIDFGFQVKGSFDAGDVITVANGGGQAHELAVYRLNDGVTLEDAQAALADPTSSSLPFTSAGGLGALAPGGSAQLALPDEPGDYMLVCFLPEVTGDAQPHFTHGMIAGLTLG